MSAGSGLARQRSGKLRRGAAHLFVIDMQDKLLPAIDGSEGVISASVRLARTARRLGVPVTVSEQYPKGLGPTVAGLKDVLGNETVTLPKVAFSCLEDEGLAARLGGMFAAGVSQTVVAGIEAHVCVLQTVLDLVASGHAVFVVEEAIGSRSATSKALAVERMRSAGAVIVDYEMVMFEWLERAGTPEFKELQSGLKG